MAAEVDLLSHSWSFPEYSSQNQSQEEAVREQGSISFGRYEKESLCWEKKSVFTHDRRKEELNKLTLPDEILVSNDEIQISIGSISNSNSAAVSVTEIPSEESTNNNIMIREEPVPSVPTVPVRLVQSEKKEKLFRAFDDLSKDWVKLKKGMLPNRRNTGAELQNYQKFESFKNGIAIKRTFGTVKDVINNSQKKESNVDKNKSSKTQLKPIKESQKSSFKPANLVPKTLKIGTAGTKSRPSTASSCNKPVLFGKSSIGTKSKEKSVVSSSTENNKKSIRSSWENLMRPTAASKARADITELKRTNIGVRKPVSLKRDSSNQTNPRSFSRNKTRPNSEKTLRASERKKIMEKKVISSGTKRVVAKKSSDSNTRLRKVLSAKTETASINKRTKISATLSVNNNKKQRHERPAWR